MVGEAFSDPGAEALGGAGSAVVSSFGLAGLSTATPTLPSRPHVIVYWAKVSKSPSCKSIPS